MTESNAKCFTRRQFSKHETRQRRARHGAPYQPLIARVWQIKVYLKYLDLVVFSFPLSSKAKTGDGSLDNDPLHLFAFLRLRAPCYLWKFVAFAFAYDPLANTTRVLFMPRGSPGAIFCSIEKSNCARGKNVFWSTHRAYCVTASNYRPASLGQYGYADIVEYLSALNASHQRIVELGQDVGVVVT